MDQKKKKNLNIFLVWYLRRPWRARRSDGGVECLNVSRRKIRESIWKQMPVKRYLLFGRHSVVFDMAKKRKKSEIIRGSSSSCTLQLYDTREKPYEYSTCVRGVRIMISERRRKNIIPEEMKTFPFHSRKTDAVVPAWEDVAAMPRRRRSRLAKRWTVCVCVARGQCESRAEKKVNSRRRHPPPRTLS